MQITLDIDNKQVAEHVLWMLNHFKKDGVKINKVEALAPEISSTAPTISNISTDERITEQYLKSHWKTLLLKSKSEPDYYKSERFKSDKANFLMGKYK